MAVYMAKWDSRPGRQGQAIPAPSRSTGKPLPGDIGLFLANTGVMVRTRSRAALSVPVLRPPAPLSRASGFSLAELLIVIAVIGILALGATPMFLSYYQFAKVRAAAQEITTFLNQGRQLAIKQNSPVCITVTATAMQYRQGTCSGTIIPVIGVTNAAGNVRAPEGINFTSTANPVFSSLGAAAPAATYTVTDPATGNSLSVTVSASGRITTGP